MNSESPRIARQHDYDDEIDLMELLAIAWRGKFIIAAVVAVGVLLGLWKAYTDQEWWAATAKVEEPRYVHYQQIQSYAAAVWAEEPGRVLKATGYDSATTVFDKFIQEYQSTDTKRRFLLGEGRRLQNSISLKVAGDESEAQERLLNYWMSEIKASSGRDETAHTLHFAAGTRQESLVLLRAYIAYVNRQVSDDFHQSLQEWVDSIRQLYQRHLASMLNQSRSKLEIDIARLEHALEIARSADVESPMADPGVDDDFAINLGAKAISAKIHELKQIEDLSVINPEIRRVQIILQELDAVEIDTDNLFPAFRYLESPTLPLSRKEPKRLLILLALAIIGGVIGIIYVFLAHAIRSYNSRPPKAD